MTWCTMRGSAQMQNAKFSEDPLIIIIYFLSNRFYSYDTPETYMSFVPQPLNCWKSVLTDHKQRFNEPKHTNRQGGLTQSLNESPGQPPGCLHHLLASPDVATAHAVSTRVTQTTCNCRRSRAFILKYMLSFWNSPTESSACYHRKLHNFTVSVMVWEDCLGGVFKKLCRWLRSRLKWLVLA